MSAEQPSKRLRATQLGLLASAPPAVGLARDSSSLSLAYAALSPAATVGHAAEEHDELRPDVFEFFAKRANKQRELEGEVARLRQREAALVGQLGEAELQLGQLRTINSGLVARQEVREAQLELELRQAQEAIKREVDRAAGLSSRLRRAEAAAADAREARLAEGASSPAALNLAAAEAAASPPAAVRALEVEVSQLRLKLEQLGADREDDQRRAAAELSTTQQRCEAEAAAVRLLQQQLEAAAAQAEAAAAAKRELESKVAELERGLVGLQGQLGEARASQGDAVLVRTLQEQLRDHEALVAEAQRLREQETNVHVLREQLEAAEARCRRAEEMLPMAADLQGQLAELEQQLGRWRLILGGTADCNTPEDVLHLLTSLQAQQLGATAAAGDKADELAAACAAAAAAQEARAEAEAAAATAAAHADEAAAMLARAERKLALLAKERDGLKAILSSYDEEYLNQQGSELGPQQRRIVTLEASVEALHAHVATLEAELAQRSSTSAGSAAAAGDAALRAQAAEARAAAAEVEAENLVRQLALLQDRLAAGEYNPATTRVLHMKHNPEVEVQRELRDTRVAELEAENGALREHLQRMEAAANAATVASGEVAGTAGTTARAAPAGGSMRMAQLEGEVALLKRRVAELQKGAERLQQVFNKQITLFREAVLLLFGYRVEMATDPTAREFKAEFVLKPQHGEEDSSLAFRLLRDGRMTLVPTTLSGRLAREVETFVQRFRSIPAFTANLTMELFQKQTQC